MLNAIDHHIATGENVGHSVRDTLVYYHTNTDDQHWFGSDSWAVKFEFNEFYAGIDSLLFEAEGANIFIPGNSGTDPLTVRLCRDSFGQPLTDPDSLLFSQTIQSSEIQYQTWNYFQFPNTIIDTTESILWLVVDYPTNSTEQFISASAIGGLQSYFLDNGYYYNMFSISYDSEFLFSLHGRFLTEGTDLDLVSIEWEEDFLDLLDGHQPLNKVVFLATTNKLSSIPPRMLRPSRFDRIIELEAPEAHVRKHYLEALLKKMPVKGIKIKEWVDATEQMSLADLKELFISVNIAHLNFKEIVNRLKNLGNC